MGGAGKRCDETKLLADDEAGVDAEDEEAESVAFGVVVVAESASVPVLVRTLIGKRPLPVRLGKRFDG